MMSDSKKKDQGICLKFCASNDISWSDGYKMLHNTYGEFALSKEDVNEFYTAFKKKDKIYEDLSNAGRSSTLNTEEVVEQRVCLKFCVSNKISCAEALKMLRTTYGVTAISKTRAYEWYKAFKEGREEVEDMPRSGRPTTANTKENIENVKEIVLENPSVGIREIAEKLGISFGSTHHILVDILRMRRVADTWHSKT